MAGPQTLCPRIRRTTAIELHPAADVGDAIMDSAGLIVLFLPLLVLWLPLLSISDVPSRSPS